MMVLLVLQGENKRRQPLNWLYLKIIYLIIIVMSGFFSTSVYGSNSEGQTKNWRYMKQIVLQPDIFIKEQVVFDNAIYVIRDRIDLGGSSVIIPAGCLLKFEGGFLYNGIVEGQMTKIKSDKRGHYNLKGGHQGLWHNLEATGIKITHFLKFMPLAPAFSWNWLLAELKRKISKKLR